MLLCQVALGDLAFNVSQYHTHRIDGSQIPDPRYTITRNYGLFL